MHVNRIYRTFDVSRLRYKYHDIFRIFGFGDIQKIWRYLIEKNGSFEIFRAFFGYLD